MVGLRTVADHIVPTITKAAAADRHHPEVVVSLPVCVTADPDGARQRAGRIFSLYGQLPSYRAMLDREGAADPSDVAIVGSEEEVAAAIARFADAGATEFSAATYGSSEERARTWSLLGSLA
jgi:5,10-methylenetetrahydromethanopterin reductase